MEKDTKAWDNYWPGLGKDTQQPHNRIIHAAEMCTKLAGKKVLEMGAGSGLTSLAFAKRGANSIALDLSWNSLKLIKENTKQQDIKPVQADVFNLPFKNASFDIVFHQGLIEHFNNPEDILKEQMRVLKEHGIFIVNVPQKFTTYTLMKHEQIKQDKWYAGWETEYSIFALKKLIKNIDGYKLKITSSFGYGTWGIVTRIRYLHYRGNMRFGRPILPKFLFKMYEAMWRAIENSFLMKFIGINVCVVGVKE